MSLPKITKETWDSLEPALHSFTPKTKALAYSVLVEQNQVSKVARDNNLSRQTVYEAVWRFAAVYEKYNETKLVPVYVWLPEDEAKAVMRMAESYMQTIRSGKEDN